MTTWKDMPMNDQLNFDTFAPFIKRFAEKMREDLGKDLKHVILADDLTLGCPTHDYIDPNQTLCDVLEEFNIEFEASNAHLCKQINGVWYICRIAKWFCDVTDWDGAFNAAWNRYVKEGEKLFRKNS